MASQNSSVIISQIYKSRNIILDLMTKQGYNTSDYTNFSVSEVNSMKQNNQLDMLLEKNKEDADTGRKNKIYIRYYLGKAIRPSNLQEMIDDLFILTETLTKKDTLFIVIKDEPNETLINELKHIWEKDGIFIVIENIKILPIEQQKIELVEHKGIGHPDTICDAVCEESSIALSKYLVIFYSFYKNVIKSNVLSIYVYYIKFYLTNGNDE